MVETLSGTALYRDQVGLFKAQPGPQDDLCRDRGRPVPMTIAGTPCTALAISTISLAASHSTCRLRNSASGEPNGLPAAHAALLSRWRWAGTRERGGNGEVDLRPNGVGYGPAAAQRRKEKGPPALGVVWAAEDSPGHCPTSPSPFPKVTDRARASTVENSVAPTTFPRLAKNTARRRPYRSTPGSEIPLFWALRVTLAGILGRSSFRNWYNPANRRGPSPGPRSMHGTVGCPPVVGGPSE